MATRTAPRAHRIRTDADTWSLVEDVTFAARVGARNCEWPDTIRRKYAGETMHAFAATEVEYMAENGTQVIRAPWVTVMQRRGDCKSTAVLIASMCAAAGRDVRLKFLDYEGEAREHWAHVYAVVDGRACDPLLPYGEEFTYIRAITKRIR